MPRVKTDAVRMPAWLRTLRAEVQRDARALDEKRTLLQELEQAHTQLTRVRARLTGRRTDPAPARRRKTEGGGTRVRRSAERAACPPKPATRTRQNRTYGQALPELCRQIVEAIRRAGQPVKARVLREATGASESYLQRALRQLRQADQVIADGNTSHRTFRTPDMPAPPPPVLAREARRSKATTPRPRDPAPAPAPAATVTPIDRTIRKALNQGASVSAGDLVRAARAAGEETDLAAVEAALQQFVAAGKVEKIPVGSQVRYRKVAKGSR